MKTKATFLMLLLFMSSTILLLNMNTPIGSLDEPANENLGKSDVIITSYTQQWLDNPTFLDPIGPTWYSGLDGASSDVAADSRNGHVNYTVIGDSGTKMFLADPPLSSDWDPFNNTEFPVMPAGDGKQMVLIKNISYTYCQ